MATSKLFQNKQEANELFLKFIEKTQDSLEKDIDTIIDWIKTQPHLPEIPSRNAVAFIFKTNKCSIEKTKQHIDLFYSIRNILPDVFENTHPRDPDMQEIVKKCYHLLLPKLTKEGNAVIIVRMRQPFTSRDYLRSLGYVFDLIEVRLAEEISLRDIIIYDCENHKMSQMLQMTPTVLRILAVAYKHVFAARIAKIIIVNSPISESLVKLVKNFMSQKLKDRLVVLDGYDKLSEHVPKEILPSNYGGDEISMEELDVVWKEKMIEYYPRFDKLRNMRVKEELRPTPLNNDEILGYYGNFKQLDVD